jgi:hypothetical protein
MATNMRGASVVVDRTLLAPMAAKAKEILRCETLDAPADRGSYSGEQLLACETIGVKASRFIRRNAKAAGWSSGFCRFD